MKDQAARLIVVDWGTTRMRATLLGERGAVLERAASDAGVQSVERGQYEAALDHLCAGWFSRAGNLPVLMSGMVGSRNGWIEVPYVPPPCGIADLTARLERVPGTARQIFIVPGVDCREADSSYDVMRGEETQALGTGIQDGLVCLPGTHSKWIEIAAGRITRFVTFATGEFYAALIQSFVGRLAEQPDDGEAGAKLAEAMADLPGGLTRMLFQARTQVLGANVSGHAVRPFLSGALIEAEVAGAQDVFGGSSAIIHLVADHPQLRPYQATLERRGFSVKVIGPEVATLAGLNAIAVKAGLLREE